MDIVTLLIMAAFYLVFGASIVRYIRSRHALELGIVLVFGSTGALFAVSAINAVVPAAAPYLGPLAVTALVAQPALMLRLVGLVLRLPRPALPLAFAGFVASLVAFYGTNRSAPATLFLVGFFALTEFFAAFLLISEGLRRRGFPRVRLTVAGAASILFGASILIAGVASAARGGGGAQADPAVTAISRLLALVAGLGYVAAFVPPRWLQRLGYRSLAFDVVRTIVSRSAGTDARVLWSGLAAAAGSILGTSSVSITPADGSLPRVDLATPPKGSVSPTSAEVPFVVRVPLRSERGPIASLEARLDGRPLFLEDDLALIELLGALTAQAVEREEALATLAAAERKVGEAAAIRASEARFRALLDAEPNAMLSISADGIVRWCTRTADALFAAGSGSLVGERFEDLIRPANAARLIHEGAPATTRYETVGVGLDGRSFPAEVALSSMEFDGSPATLAVITDITWRREAEQVRDQFIGVLSHELRTPITAIFGGAHVLMKRGSSLTEETRVDLLASVAGEAERLERMVENLLILARVERGSDVVDISPVLLQRIIPSVVERETATWPGLTLRADIPDRGLPPVAGDEASIALVLRNLISNAGKYAGDGARVDVNATLEPDDGIVVTVRDDGPGIDPAEVGQLFELYFRSRSTRSAPGSGIGLFVCRVLIEAMGGRIWAAPLPGRGSEFGFALPRYVDPGHDSGGSDGHEEALPEQVPEGPPRHAHRDRATFRVEAAGSPE